MASDDSWCQACGFYRAVGAFVDAPPEEAQSEDSEPALSLEWLHCIIGVTVPLLAVVASSVTGRLMTDPNTAARFWYSTGQIGIGFVMAVSAHIAAWIYGLRHSDSIRVQDIVLDPVDIWRCTLEKLPESWCRFTIGFNGLIAVILGFTVVEGLSLNQLTPPARKSPKPQLMNKIVSAVTAAGETQAGDESQTLEEAIEEFTTEDDDIDVGLEAGSSEKEERLAQYNPWDDLAANNSKVLEPVEEREDIIPDGPLKCVIIGYSMDDGGNIDQLLVARMHRGKLTYVGTVADGVRGQLEFTLQGRLRRLVQETPSINCPESERETLWVRPAATCSVTCEKIDGNGQLVGPVFGETTPKINAPDETNEAPDAAAS